MTSTATGLRAETEVIRHLSRNGYQVLDRNWKTRTCEIDIIAYRNRTIYFIEVKYRQSSNQGSGFAYITPAKQKRMAYAARLWIEKYGWRGQFVLSGASVDGPGFEVRFIEQI
jgi:uncharacterized protein (TIGR00252 family)